MTERPILFTAPMIRAILSDRKTQTRRVIPLKWAPELTVPVLRDEPPHWRIYTGGGSYMSLLGPGLAEQGSFCRDIARAQCRHGQPGDYLWGRETWATSRHWNGIRPSEIDPDASLWYRADKSPVLRLGHRPGPWRPSIHMPRWASRVLLEIKSVRVERVQEINLYGVMEEGIEEIEWIWEDLCNPPHPSDWVKAFSIYWDSLNDKPRSVRSNGKIVGYISYPWEDVQENREHRGLPWRVVGNPWVWPIEFELCGESAGR